MATRESNLKISTTKGMSRTSEGLGRKAEIIGNMALTSERDKPRPRLRLRKPGKNVEASPEGWDVEAELAIQRLNATLRTLDPAFCESLADNLDKRVTEFRALGLIT